VVVFHLSTYDPIDPGQVDVHEDEIRTQAPGGFDRVLAGASFSGDLEPFRRPDHLACCSPERLLVVDDQHSHGHPLDRA
jgi:hypothetical protein